MKIPIVNEQDEIIGYKDRKDRNADDIIRVSGFGLKMSMVMYFLRNEQLARNEVLSSLGPSCRWYSGRKADV